MNLDISTVIEDSQYIFKKNLLVYAYLFLWVILFCAIIKNRPETENFMTTPNVIHAIF